MIGTTQSAGGVTPPHLMSSAPLLMINAGDTPKRKGELYGCEKGDYYHN